MKKYTVILGAILLIAAASTAYAYWENPKVAGGGSILVPGGYATFGVVSQDGIYKGAYGYKGNIEYINHSGSVELNLHSVNITDLECTRPYPLSNTPVLCTAANIKGYATVNGVSGYTFEVNVEDNGEPAVQGTPPLDKFDITINKDGSEIYPKTGGDLTGGNIQVFGQVYLKTD